MLVHSWANHASQCGCPQGPSPCYAGPRRDQQPLGSWWWHRSPAGDLGPEWADPLNDRTRSIGRGHFVLPSPSSLAGWIIQLLRFKRLADGCVLALVNEHFSRQDLTRDTVSASVPNALVEPPHEWRTSQVAKRVRPRSVPQHPRDGCYLGAVSLDPLAGTLISSGDVSGSSETACGDRTDPVCVSRISSMAFLPLP